MAFKNKQTNIIKKTDNRAPDKILKVVLLEAKPLITFN